MSIAVLCAWTSLVLGLPLPADFSSSIARQNASADSLSVTVPPAPVPRRAYFMGVKKPTNATTSGPFFKHAAPLKKSDTCVDSSDWADESGFDCSWYAADGTVARCTFFAVEDDSAKLHCCACGGGHTPLATLAPVATAALRAVARSDEAPLSSVSDVAKMMEGTSKVSDNLHTITTAAASASEGISQASSTLAGLGTAFKGISGVLGSAGIALSLVTLFLPKAPSAELVAIQDGFQEINERLRLLNMAVDAGFAELRNVVVVTSATEQVTRHIEYLGTVEFNLRNFEQKPHFEVYKNRVVDACTASGQTPMDVMRFLFRSICVGDDCSAVAGMDPSGLSAKSFSQVKLDEHGYHLRKWYDHVAAPVLLTFARAMTLHARCAAIEYDATITAKGALSDALSDGDWAPGDEKLAAFEDFFAEEVARMEELRELMQSSVSSQYDTLKKCWTGDLLVKHDLEKAGAWSNAAELKQNLESKYEWLHFNVAYWTGDIPDQVGRRTAAENVNDFTCRGGGSYLPHDNAYSLHHKWGDKNVVLQWWPAPEAGWGVPENEWYTWLDSLPDFNRQEWCSERESPVRRTPNICDNWDDWGHNTCWDQAGTGSKDYESLFSNGIVGAKMEQWGFTALWDGNPSRDNVQIEPHNSKCAFRGLMGPEKHKAPGGGWCSNGRRRAETAIMVNCAYLAVAIYRQGNEYVRAVP